MSRGDHTQPLPRLPDSPPTWDVDAVSGGVSDAGGTSRVCTSRGKGLASASQLAVELLVTPEQPGKGGG